MRVVRVLFLLAVCGCGGGGGGVPAPVIVLAFTDQTAAAGIVVTNYGHQGVYSFQFFTGGAAAGDFDGDGFVDLYVHGGDLQSNMLYRNKGDGTFEDVAAAAGVDLPGAQTCGPSFADYDGDGWLDLFIGGLAHAPSYLFRNKGDGTFEDVTAASGLVMTRFHTISAAWADYDNDGDLDVCITHYDSTLLIEPPTELLWQNNGDGTFTDVTAAAGLEAIYLAFPEWSFTPNWADIDDDGDPDLLMTSDFGWSRVFVNNGNGTFSSPDRPVITDENGMGAALGDYDNDGDIDWFVSSIFDDDGVIEGNWGPTGNRLYQNDGNGAFTDVTSAAGVRNGFWGWGSCFADLNNDGWLDLVHTNGAHNAAEPDFVDDPTRVFLSNRDGTFTERAVQVGIDDRLQGRGLVCLDYDNDGDLDLFVSNNGEQPRLFRNEGVPGHWLAVRLRGTDKNTEGVGARVYVTAGGETQMRELRAGNNYVSSNAVIAHFGLGGATVAETVRVEWPDGAESILNNVVIDRTILIAHP